MRNLVLLILVSSQLIIAQHSVQKKADYYFSAFSYAKAIPLYENLLKQNSNTNHAHKQLAECYLLIRDYQKAIPHFEAIINNINIPSDYYFKYAMALNSNGQKDEAAKWLKKYKKYNKNDSRVKRFLKDGNLASIVFNSKERYEVNNLDFNSPGSDFGTFIHQGKLYFSSSRVGKGSKEDYGLNGEPWLDIFTIDENDTSSEPELVKGDINSKYHESSVVFSTDHKNDTIMYFTRNNFLEKKERYGFKKVNNLKIYQAEFVDGEWRVKKSLRINNDYFSNAHPAVSPDRKRLYFTSDRPGGYGGTDIYYSEIHERGGVLKPVNAGPVINTEGNEMFPFVNTEGKLFFSSDGHVGYGQSDIFSAIIDENGNFVDIINLGKPLNSSADDFGFYANANGGSGYISSNREGGKGGDDIYKFVFIPPLTAKDTTSLTVKNTMPLVIKNTTPSTAIDTIPLTIKGTVKDAVNKLPLNEVAISLFDKKTNEKLGEAMTDTDGKYKISISRKKDYMLMAVRKTHPHKEQVVKNEETEKSTKIKTIDILLEPSLDVKVLADVNKIYFDANKSNIRPDTAKELDKIVKLMTETYPNIIIKLEAHTAHVASHIINDELSEQRVKSTYAYLIEKGVSKQRITSYKGYGKRKPINECTSTEDCSPEELERNERIELTITQIKSKVAKTK